MALGIDSFQYRKRQVLLQRIKRRWYQRYRNCIVSIPQAVGTVATLIIAPSIIGHIIEFQYRKRQVLLQRELCSQHVNLGYGVSIPQAVGTVATIRMLSLIQRKLLKSFNTASGRYCCNYTQLQFIVIQLDLVAEVSIPQAVGTVATFCS